MVDIRPLLYGFMVNSAWEVALVHNLYLHKKMRSLNSHCTEYKYFKDDLIVYMDISSSDWLYTFQTRIISSIIRRWRNLGFSPSVENFESIWEMLFESTWVMLQKIKECINAIKRYPGRIFKKFETVESSFEILFCVHLITKLSGDPYYEPLVWFMTRMYEDIIKNIHYWFYSCNHY